MNYDTWKTTPDEELYYRGPSRQQIADKLADLDREIEWLLNALSNLVLGDEDREQTEDLIEELRGERNSLSWCANAS